MTAQPVRIATRKSPLALWQAEHVARLLKGAHPGLVVELVPMSTKGDRILDTPLARIGGKGLFVKELEDGLLTGRADLAVHSLKDVPPQQPPGLHVPVILAREDPLDAFVSSAWPSLEALPRGARIGTASLRRQCQLLAQRPDLRISTLRGNVNTRLARLDAGEFDAIILAAAGLERLGLGERIRTRLSAEQSLPAAGQGALGIECRRDDERIQRLIAPLHDTPTGRAVAAERALTARLGGSCQVPIGAYARLEGDEIHLRGLVGAPDGGVLICGEIKGDPTQGPALGAQLGETLLARGAAEILQALLEAP